MYHQTILLGNVGRDPELRYTPAGKAVCDLSVAVNEKWTDGEGKAQEKTTWYRVSCWNKLAENVNQYVKKGDRVFVTGRAAASAWIDNDGLARAQLELTAQEVKFLGKGEKGGHENPTKPEAMQEIPF